MNTHYVVTSGLYSDYCIMGVFETELDSIKYIDTHHFWDSPIIEVWINEIIVKKLKLVKGGFAEGQIDLIWQRKEPTEIVKQNDRSVK